MPDDEAASPPVRAGDLVRVVLPALILHTHGDGHGGAGVCSVGIAGTVTRVLKMRRHHPPSRPAIASGWCRPRRPCTLTWTATGGAGVCSVGLAVTVMRVLEGRAYPKNVAVAEDMMID